ncbi:PQQ-binding-like beta-propeller repeat protein [Verrucomicrobium spinosum]|uniref:outer membrane protein assembly factor BamB family protein n=2 Tax=Verrucomicrobium spinosum TaxID=2736 RepID=UPI00017468FA|nr:PQQ-binding-like beta-propeller repeat protein [Verrucomicrobium spinosum]
MLTSALFKTTSARANFPGFRRKMVLAGLAGALLVLPAIASAQDWQMGRGDAAMRGQSPTALNFPLELAWTAELGNKARREGVIATPVVRDGKVYVGSQSGNFACLDLTTGKEVWKIKKDSFFEGNAGFAGALVIVGCGDAFVYAFDAATGKEVWKFETDGEVHAGVNHWTGPDGKQRVLIGSYDNRLYCLDAATGQKHWDYETTNYVNGAVAIYENQVVFGGCDGVLYVLDIATGKEVKKIEVGAYIGNNVAADKGMAYVAHYGNRVSAFSFGDGAKLWEFGEREFPYYAAPAVNDTWVVAGGRDKRIYGLDRAKGEAKWQFRTRGDVDSSPVICAGVHVIAGSNDGYFYALDLSKGEEVWRYEVGAPVKTAPAVAGDYVLIGADDGNVYCFKNGKSTPK